MNFLLLGIDSLIAGIAVCAIVSPRARLPLAALFGIADAAVFLVAPALGLRIAGGASDALEAGILVAVGLYLLIVVAGMRPVAARWPLWVLPWALTLDNLAYGAVGDHSAGSLLQQAGQQGLLSALLALVGLLAAVALPRMERTSAARVAGGALVVAAGGLLLLG